MALGPARAALIAFMVAVSSQLARPEPITLKFAYFSSDRTSTYRSAIKPFVDAVNSEEGGVHIEVALSGALGRNPAKQAQLVLDGTADIAFVVPGYTPELFPDDGVIQLPGFYGGVEPATRVYRGLVADGALRGYDKFFVVGVFAGEPETIHSRPPIATLDDLAGKRIRVNNPIEGAAIEKLGATPAEIPINQTATAMSSGEIDGAALPASDPLIEFGVARIAANHYLLGLSSVPLAVLMNRQVFDELPQEAQDVILKYSGEWTAKRFIADTKAAGERVLAELRSDPRRTVIDPSAADLERAEVAFAEVLKDWLAASPRNPQLLAKAEAELAHME